MAEKRQGGQGGQGGRKRKPEEEKAEGLDGGETSSQTRHAQGNEGLVSKERQESQARSGPEEDIGSEGVAKGHQAGGRTPVGEEEGDIDTPHAPGMEERERAPDQAAQRMERADEEDIPELGEFERPPQQQPPSEHHGYGGSAGPGH